jgi:hypothetical protein
MQVLLIAKEIVETKNRAESAKPEKKKNEQKLKTTPEATQKKLKVSTATEPAATRGTYCHHALD